MVFEVHNINDLPDDARKGNGRTLSAKAEALLALKGEEAMFLPLSGVSMEGTRNAANEMARRLGLKIHTRIDREKNGVWVWLA